MKTNKNRINSPMGLRICLYVMLLAFGSCSSCKKDVNPVNELPPATQTGANTAGCLINGQPWIAKGDSWAQIKPITTGGIQNQFLTINLNFISGSGGYQEEISLCINDYQTLGEKMLNFNTVFYPNTAGVRPANYGRYVRRNITESSYMTTVDVVGKVTLTQFHELRSDGPVSGTFEFDAIDPVTNKIISIKNGRFDIK